MSRTIRRRPILATLGALALGFALTQAISTLRFGAPDIEAPGHGDRVGPRERLTEADRLAALAAVKEVGERKALFLDLVVPVIAEVNEALLAERAVVRALADRLADDALTPGERAALERIKRRHGVAADDLGVLMRRVDAVPMSLALAQAALESGWGTSRFAREANALFGERTWRDGAGLIPEARAADETHAVRAFDDLAHSVRSYVDNLNSGKAYAAFRAARAAQRRAGAALDGAILAGTLRAYSEDGEAYVATLRAIMRDNRLEAYDQAAGVALRAEAERMPVPRT